MMLAVAHASELANAARAVIVVPLFVLIIAFIVRSAHR